MSEYKIINTLVAIERKIRSTKSTINKLLDQNRNTEKEIHEMNLQLSDLMNQVTVIKEQLLKK